MTVLRGIDFGPCWDAPGVRGWFGEGYWFHHLPLVKHFYNFEGSTRVAKTTTLFSNAGNMPIYGRDGGWGPREFFPACIKVYWLSGRTFNSVGLTGPGLDALIKSGLLRDEEPRMISFMSTAKTKEDRLHEYRQYVDAMKRRLKSGVVMPGLGQQANLTCPNTGLDVGHLDADEARRILDIMGELNMPTVVKINILAPPKDVKLVADHPVCDAICVTNALPFKSVSTIPWDTLYPNGSPLALRNPKFGGGGYSGPELVVLVGEYIKRCLNLGIEKPWNAGGGIRKASDVNLLCFIANLRPGIDSIFFASAAMVRPWNIRPIIRKAHERLG
jgi:dihydroorotate dehydrogenase